MYGPDYRTKTADFLNIPDAEKITVRIVQMNNIYLVFLDKIRDFSETVGDRLTVIPVIVCLETIEYELGLCVIKSHYIFRKGFRTFVVADNFPDPVPARLHPLENLIGHHLCASADISGI